MRETVVVIGGMTCSACVNAITTQVEAIEHVDQVVISLATNEGRVLYEGEESISDTIRDTIENCGFDCSVVSDTDITPNDIDFDSDLNGSIVTCVITVKGMTCAACVNSIVGQLKQLDGIINVELSLLTEECLTTYDSSKLIIDNIIETIEDCGFDATLVSSGFINNQTKISKTNFIISNRNMVTDSKDLIKQKFDSLISRDIVTVNYSFNEENPFGDSMEIEYNQLNIGIRDLVKLVKQKIGYEIVTYSNYDKSTQLDLLSKKNEIDFWKSRCFKSCSIAIIVLLLYMGIPMLAKNMIEKKSFPYNQVGSIKGLYYRDIIGFLLATYVIVRIGSYFYKSCWKSLKHGTGTMDTLISISTLSAYIFSICSIIYNIIDQNDFLPNVVFDTSVMLIAFISLGKFLENRAKSQTSSALSKLILLSPNTCTLIETKYPTDSLDDKPKTEISTDYLQLNDIIEVQPGMKVPIDGIIIQGETEIDESLMTGESNLIHKNVKSNVIGGTINGPGHFYFKVTSVGSDTKLSKIISTIKTAQLSKTPIQKYADKLCSIFVPIIVTLAIATFFTWYALSRLDTFSAMDTFAKSKENNIFICVGIATSVIIVACPCALGLATPTAIMVGTGVGAQNGVLIKDGEAIEKCRDIKGFIFDKTGTLTTGKMSVKNFSKYENNLNHLDGLNSCEIWYLIKICELKSEHPIARAIVNYSETQLEQEGNLEDMKVKLEVLNCNIILGQGIECIFKNIRNDNIYKVCIGSGTKLFTNDTIRGQINILDNEFLSVNEGCSISYVAINDVLIGRFEMIDTLKSDSFETIQYLKSNNYKIFIVTGDNHSAAMKIGMALEIDPANVYSEVSPNGKCDLVKYLQKQFDGTMAFVGDGINDSPALTVSDLGIAISTGTEIAIDAANLVILGDSEETTNEFEQKNTSLKRLIYALDISQKTYQRIRLNLFWALSYNTFMVPIAMGILVPWGITLPPMLAGLAMALSSVSVVLSSLRLKKWIPPDIEDVRMKTDDTENPLKKLLTKFLFWRSKRSYESLNTDLELQTDITNN